MIRKHLLLAAAILIASASAASADELVMSGLGDGQGWNDGAYYTGYVNLNFDGQNYAGLCVDALHDTFGNSWNAVYVPLTNTATLAAVMKSYFSMSNPAVYMPDLYADVVGWLQLGAPGLTEAANNNIQHAVWSQLDPSQFSDTIGLYQEAQADAPNGYGTIPSPAGGTITVNLSNFGLLVDANYAHGGTLEQAFLVDGVNTPEPANRGTAGAALLGLFFLMACRRHKTA